MSTQGVLRDILLPYQMRWVDDAARYKIGMWSRQTGKSFATAAEAVVDCQLRPGQLWVCLSAGERQAFEWLRKARQWSEAVELAMSGYSELSDAADARKSKGEIAYRNGSRIVAIPANPATARGYSANLVLDEFALHEDSWGIWAAIAPSITNPINGTKRIRVVSTPHGLGNKFADLWQRNRAYSRHKITIDDAVAQGLQVDIADLREGVDDPDIWAQEYMCQFLDSASVLLSYDLIAACTTTQQSLEAVPLDAPLYVGMDVGRSRDLSVITILARVGDTLYLVGCREMHRMAFRDQLETICEIAGSRIVRRACIDATGIGAMLAEEARRRCGGKVDPVQFTARSKGDMYQAMRRAFEDRSIRIPVDRDLREDLHGVQRNVSQGGSITYSAPRTADGHSDRASALALAIRAATARGEYVAPVQSHRYARGDQRRIWR